MLHDKKFTSLMSVIFVFFMLIEMKALAIDLSQKDFDHGTYVIREPGYYRLVEDISFNPNSFRALGRDAYSSSYLLPHQYTHAGGRYDPRAFGIGFFAAIVIQADGVTLDLNGHRIEQSKEHALMQRFFAVIELASAPFVPDQGPHNFGSRLESASNTRIINGTIGRSSHHGIHGNGNKNILIENVDFEDFEVAAVALNGVKGLTLKNSRARSRTDVPVLGTFSSALFLRHYLDELVRRGATTTLRINGEKALSVHEIREQLRTAINHVHSDLIVKGRRTIDPDLHPEEYALFHNKEQVVDGNCYGYLVNAMGQAVEGFAHDQKIAEENRAQDILIENVHVVSLRGHVTEVVTLKKEEDATVDPIGAVFQLKNRHPDTGKLITMTSEDDLHAHYIGNSVANAQVLIAKAFLNGAFEGSYLDFSRLRIDEEVVRWVEAEAGTQEASLANLMQKQKGYFCNADSMFHVNKGVIAFRIDAANNVKLNNTSAQNVVNSGEVCSEICGYYQKSHQKATLEGCGGPHARGYCLASSRDVVLDHCHVRDLISRCGSAVGIDILTECKNISIKNCSVRRVVAGPDYHPTKSPQREPFAVGVHVDERAIHVDLEKVRIDQLRTRYHAIPISDERNQRNRNL